MKFSVGRLNAVLRKELREYRRSPFIIGTMAVLPLVFLVEPLIIIFRIGPSVGAAAVDKAVGVHLSAPADRARIAPRGHRRVLGGRRARAGHARAPAHDAASTRGTAARQGDRSRRPRGWDGVHPLRAHPDLRPALRQQRAGGLRRLAGPHILAEILFAPLLAGWSIWVGIGDLDARERRPGCSAAGDAVEPATARGRGPGVLQRLHSERHARGGVRSWSCWSPTSCCFAIVSAMFDRERLITGAGAQRAPAGGGAGPPPGAVRRIPRVGG